MEKLKEDINMNKNIVVDRRGFITAAAALAAAPSVLGGAKRVFKVALIGCGGRGTGAAGDITAAAKHLGCEVKFVACCDFFKEKAVAFAQKFGVPASWTFDGARGYRSVMESDAEIVLLATPPFFRPLHFKAAVAAGKHVFVEKPAATDPRGLRDFLETAKVAKARDLSVLAGTVHRHSNRYLRQLKAFRSGEAIGRPVAGQAYRCGSVIMLHPRKPGMTNAAYLCDNWYFFRAMSGDQVVEQAMHQVDDISYMLDRYPKSAFGLGARVRRPAGIGDVYDCQAIDWDYGDEFHVTMLARQMDGCKNRVGARIVGTEGTIMLGEWIKRYDGKTVPPDEEACRGRLENHFVQEHVDFLNGLLTGRKLFECESVAYSTATAMIGTFACYSGQEVAIDDILVNKASPFYDGYNNTIVPEMFDETEDVPVPTEGIAPVPGVKA